MIERNAIKEVPDAPNRLVEYATNRGFVVPEDEETIEQTFGIGWYKYAWDTYFGAAYTHGTPFRRAAEEGPRLLSRRSRSPRPPQSLPRQPAPRPWRPRR